MTASVVGQIVRRNPGLNVQNILKNMLYSTFKGNASTRYGLKEERATIHDYLALDDKSNYTVSPCGLLISHNYTWLGASPDGAVHEGSSEQILGLLEVKNVLRNKLMTFKSATKDSSFCLEVSCISSN